MNNLLTIGKKISISIPVVPREGIVGIAGVTAGAVGRETCGMAETCGTVGRPAGIGVKPRDGKELGTAPPGTVVVA